MKFRARHSDIKEKINFVGRMLKSRWFVVVCAIWIQCCSGSAYTFGIYSQSIKVALNYNQKHLDTLASFKDLGANVGIVSGIIFEHTSPWAVLAIGALQSGFGYLMIWLSVVGRVPSPAFWEMCLYMFMAANGSTYFNTATVVTCVENFPRSRGIVIGLMKGFLGLSGAILTQLYRAIYAEAPESYIFMLMWLPTLMALAWMLFLRPLPSLKRSNESENLYLMSAIALFLAAYLMTLIIIENTMKLTHLTSVITCSICGLILLLPLGVVYKSEREDAEVDVFLSSSSSSNPSPSLKQPLLPPPSLNFESASSSSAFPGSTPVPPEKDPKAKAEESGAKKGYHSKSEGEASEAADEGTRVERREPHRGENHTFIQAVKKADFWLLFVAMACGMGSGLTAIDNMGQIGASQGYSVQKVGTFISLLSIWNFLGRLGFGTISEICLHRYRIARPVFLALTQATMSIGHLIYAVAFPGSLYVGSVIIGLCYGAQWSLMPAITSEIFGLVRFGTLFNTIAIASPLGAYFLSVQVAGRIYDYEAEKEGIPVPLINDLDGIPIFRWLKSSELLCNGAQCFRMTFIIMAIVSFFGCLVCLILVARTKTFYYQGKSPSRDPMKSSLRSSLLCGWQDQGFAANIGHGYGKG
ncbi:hypothetical protein R1flu_023054 [Riccia fluitans]|uniref:Nodulin-like domain-containing protein n=1 Tax=Riccia fluitans TaxID=41844 RepID=A0ABD1XQY2_9MARC